MNKNPETLHVARGTSLSTPTERTLKTDTIWFWDTDPPRCRILLEWHAWEQVNQDALFSLADDVLSTDLAPAQDVIIESEFKPDEANVPSTQAELRTELANPNSPLRETSSWTALSVTQSDPLPDEQELTNTVFSTKKDADPKPHVGELNFRRSSVDNTPTDTEETTRQTVSFSQTTGAELIDPESTDEFQAVISELRAVEASEETSQSSDRFELKGDENREVSIVPAERDGWCAVVAYASKTIESNKKAVTSELMTMSQERWRGRFELNSSTGRVSFYIPVPVAADSITEAIDEATTAVAEYEDTDLSEMN